MKKIEKDEMYSSLWCWLSSYGMDAANGVDLCIGDSAEYLHSIFYAPVVSMVAYCMINTYFLLDFPDEQCNINDIHVQNLYLLL